MGHPRLENVLLNPITIKRIELVCGCSVEEFLAEPSKFRDKFADPNYKWMCTVTKEEAQASLERMLSWAKDDKLPSGGSLSRWIFSRASLQKSLAETATDNADIIMAITSNAAQRDWETPSEFLCCPQKISHNPILAYAEKLEMGSVFCRNKYATYLVSKYELSIDQQSLYIVSESAKSLKPWTLAKITFEDGLFLHTGLGTFFTQNGVEKELCLEQGKEWTGEDSFDDYC